MTNPYTKDDLCRGEQIARELHGINFYGWAEHIAKYLAAERGRRLRPLSMDEIDKAIDKSHPACPSEQLLCEVGSVYVRT